VILKRTMMILFVNQQEALYKMKIILIIYLYLSRKRIVRARIMEGHMEHPILRRATHLISRQLLEATQIRVASPERLLLARDNMMKIPLDKYSLQLVEIN
jgi:hypothetical protein